MPDRRGSSSSLCYLTGIPLVPTVVQDLQQAISKLEARLSTLEKSSPTHRATAPQTQVSLPTWEGTLYMSWLLSLPTDCLRQD